MHDLQNWITRYLVDCKYEKGIDPKAFLYRQSRNGIQGQIGTQGLRDRRILSHRLFQYRFAIYLSDGRLLSHEDPD